MIVETDAIILRSIKYGDTSKIITCYTQKFGQIKLIAKGARGKKNKFGSSLEILSESHIVFYKKEGRDLNLLSKCELTQSVNSYLNDADVLKEALSIVELFYKTHSHEEKNQKAYQLLSETLKALPKNKLNINQIMIHFYLNFVSLFGVSFTLDKCISCKTSFENIENLRSAFLNFSDGTLICEACFVKSKIKHVVKIDKILLQQLLFINNLNPYLIANTTFPVYNYHELRNNLFKFICTHIDGITELRSLKLF